MPFSVDPADWRKRLSVSLGTVLALTCMLYSTAGAQPENPDNSTSRREVHQKAQKEARSKETRQKEPAQRTSSATPKSRAKTAKVADKPTLSQDGIKTVEANWQKLDPQTRGQLEQLAQTLRTENRSIYNELRDDEELAMTDIGMLWEAAVERSGAVRYAIEKLSRRDATGKPVDNDAFSKRVVQSLVHLGGVAGTMWTGTPAGMIGSNMLQNLIAGDPTDPALSRVTDADMVILAKEVDALQTQLITLYYNYRHAREKLALSQEASSTIAKYFQHANVMQGVEAEKIQPLMQYVHENTKRDEQTSRQAYQSSRTALALVVGPDALGALERASAEGSRTAKPAAGKADSGEKPSETATGQP